MLLIRRRDWSVQVILDVIAVMLLVAIEREEATLNSYRDDIDRTKWLTSQHVERLSIGADFIQPRILVSITHSTRYFPPAPVHGIAMSMSVCLSVCSETTPPNFMYILKRRQNTTSITARRRTPSKCCSKTGTTRFGLRTGGEVCHPSIRHYLSNDKQFKCK